MAKVVEIKCEVDLDLPCPICLEQGRWGRVAQKVNTYKNIPFLGCSIWPNCSWSADGTLAEYKAAKKAGVNMATKTATPAYTPRLWHDDYLDEGILRNALKCRLTKEQMVATEDQYSLEDLGTYDCKQVAQDFCIKLDSLSKGEFYQQVAYAIVDDMGFDTVVQVVKGKKPAKAGKVNKMAKKDKVVSAAVHGLKVGTADEAGELLLDTAEVILGAKVKGLLDTEEKRSLVKGLTAIMLMHATELVTEDGETAEKVDAACELVIEAASRDLFQPKAKELRRVMSLLAEVGGKALLDKIS